MLVLRGNEAAESETVMNDINEIRMPKKRDKVRVVDSTGKHHDALVTNHWNHTINAVYVTDDDSKTDTYGNQIERITSCVHQSLTAAPGYFWYWPEDVK